MSSRKRVGFSSSASEASRRQLMQPVPCWEKIWVLPEGAPLGTLKVFKWVKTEKRQHFSDDESEELTNQPLAPLPDEPEVVDDDMDVDEGTASVPPNTAPASREVTEPLPTKPESKPATPKPHPLSVSFQPDESPAPLPDPVPETAPDTPTDFVEFLKPEEATFDAEPALDGDLSLDMTQMGPDGEPFETTNDLSQLEPDDALLGGGPLLDQAMEEDPFAGEQPT